MSDREAVERPTLRDGLIDIREHLSVNYEGDILNGENPARIAIWKRRLKDINAALAALATSGEPEEVVTHAELEGALRVLKDIVTNDLLPICQEHGGEVWIADAIRIESVFEEVDGLLRRMDEGPTP